MRGGFTPSDQVHNAGVGGLASDAHNTSHFMFSQDGRRSPRKQAREEGRETAHAWLLLLQLTHAREAVQEDSLPAVQERVGRDSCFKLQINLRQYRNGLCKVHAFFVCVGSIHPSETRDLMSMRIRFIHGIMRSIIYIRNMHDEHHQIQ